MFLRILAILGALAAAAMFWIIGDTKDQLEAELQSTENSLTQSQNNLRSLEDERDELEEELASLNEELEESLSNATQLDNQLTQVRRELNETRQAMSEQEDESETLRAEAEQIRSQLLEERTRIAELEENLQDEDAEDLRTSIRALENQLLETERQLQTAGTTESDDDDSETEERPRQVLRGEVTEVGPDSAFVVINLGPETGVRQNASVMIRRGPRYIGRAVIKETEDGGSIAEVQPGASSIQPGDLAITLN